MGWEEPGQDDRGLRTLPAESGAPASQSSLLVPSSTGVAETWLLICSENVYCLSSNHTFMSSSGVPCPRPSSQRPVKQRGRVG